MGRKVRNNVSPRNLKKRSLVEKFNSVMKLLFINIKEL